MIRLEYLIIFKRFLVVLAMRADEGEKNREKKDSMEETKDHNT